LDKVQQILQDIVKSDKRAGQVITRLRSLFKKEETQHAPVDVNDVVQEVLALMRSDLLSRQVSVSTELASELPLVSGDRVQLLQVLLNLLVNACDAMAHMPAPRSLLVRSRRVSTGEVVVEVADDGTGIAPDDLERIFEPFVSTKPQGMGLGLAVCRSIARAHGGRLWATNSPGGGATLTLELPAIDS
jgi:signal transduction histidine kinase